MRKKSYLSYRSPGFVLGMFLFALSFLNVATLLTSWSIGTIHIYLWGVLFILILALILGIVYMYWNARWEESISQEISLSVSVKDQEKSVGG